MCWIIYLDSIFAEVPRPLSNLHLSSRSFNIICTARHPGMCGDSNGDTGICHVWYQKTRPSSGCTGTSTGTLKYPTGSDIPTPKKHHTRNGFEVVPFFCVTVTLLKVRLLLLYPLEGMGIQIYLHLTYMYKCIYIFFIEQEIKSRPLPIQTDTIG